VDLQNPTGSEIEWLHAHYPNLHPLHFVDVASPYQHCKLDEQDDYMFLVMHFPVLDSSTQLTLASQAVAGEVDIFVGLDYLITVHSGQLRPVLGLLDQVSDIPSTRAAVMSRGSGYLLYTVLERLVEYCFPLLNAIDQKIQRIESMIFSDHIRRNVYEISVVRRDILAFRHVLQPQVEILTDLEERAEALAPLLGADLVDYFRNLNNRMARIWHTIEANKEVIEGLNDTHDSLINAHINIVIKVLTVFSVLLLPMTLISSIYGMNFAVLPLSHNPDGFWLAMGMMLITAVAMLAYFKWRRWV
jgi:magnesium transporter